MLRISWVRSQFFHFLFFGCDDLYKYIPKIDITWAEIQRNKHLFMMVVSFAVKTLLIYPLKWVGQGCWVLKAPLVIRVILGQIAINFSDRFVYLQYWQFDYCSKYLPHWWLVVVHRCQFHFCMIPIVSHIILSASHWRA